MCQEVSRSREIGNFLYIGIYVCLISCLGTANAILSRWSFAVWLLFCFIITSGFSCNLRALILKPSEEKAIGSFQEVIVSGIPWKRPKYGGYLEEATRHSSDSVTRTIMTETIEIPLQFLYINHVSHDS